MITYPHRIRLQRGHLVHLARSTRGGLTITQLTTACGHTYEVRGIADLRAEGTLCRGCRIAAQEGADAFPVIGSTSPAPEGRRGMSFTAQTIAELRLRAAQLRVKAAALDYKIPGEGMAAQSRRFRQAARHVQQAADYERLALLAEGEE